MKQLFVCVAAILFSACNNSTPKGNAGKIDDTSAKTPTDTSVTSTDSPGDTTVWAGSFAKWINDNGDKIPGDYDTTNQVFVVCASHVTMKVDPNRVKFESGNCDDGSAPLRIALMIIKKDSARLLHGDLVAVDSTAGKTPTAVFRVNNQEKKVILNERQYSNIRRIKATRKVNPHLVKPN